MSLILDTLNKMKEGKKKKPIPPSLSKRNKANNTKKKYILLFSIMILLSTVMTFLIILGDKFVYENSKITKIIPTNDTDKKEPSVTSYNKPENTSKEDNTFSKNLPKKIPELQTSSKVQINQNPQPNKNIQNVKSYKEKDKNFLYSSYLSLANKYIEEQNFKKALIFLKKAYKLYPSQKVLKNIVAIEISLGHISDLPVFIKKIKNPEFLSEILIELIEKGETSFVHDYLTKNLQNDKSGYLNYVAGYLYEKEGDYKKAEVYYQKAYELNRKDFYLGYAYARILEINGNYSKALKIYKEIKKLHITDNKLREVVAERIKLIGEF